jgi:transcriptional regulator with XRE-family HTH domain/predicted GIY-YIG superfamily endonuclease
VTHTEDEQTAVYRIYDAEDALLYIGISNSFGRRWTEHAKVQPWWPLRRKQIVTWCDSRKDAEDAEEAAIQAEAPRYNVMHARKIRQARANRWLRRPGGLADALYRMRQTSGLAGYELASNCDWHRTKVSRLESGRRMPSPEDLKAWATACGHPEAAEQLIGMLQEVEQRRNGYLGSASYPAYVHREATTTVIPELLQTVEYTKYRMIERVRFAGAPESSIQSGVNARLRAQMALYDTSRSFEFVIHETGLRLWPCSREAMLGQLDRLLTLTELPNLLVQIVPMRQFGSPESFTLLPGPAAKVQRQFHDVICEDGAALEYERLYRCVAASAVAGGEARQIISNAIEFARAAA